MEAGGSSESVVTSCKTRSYTPMEKIIPLPHRNGYDLYREKVKV
jgi:hypothetical protein